MTHVTRYSLALGLVLTLASQSHAQIRWRGTAQQPASRPAASRPAASRPAASRPAQYGTPPPSGQPNAGYPRPEVLPPGQAPYGASPAGPDLEQQNWIFAPQPPPRQVKVNDIVTIRVDELSRMSAEGELDRRKNALYDLTLQDWLILDGFRFIKPSPQSNGDPRIQGSLNQRYRAEGEKETQESLIFNIAAKVADVRPNGNLVLEAHKQIRISGEVWEYSLSGICSPDHVGPENLVLSRNIVDLRIEKRERGAVAESIRRGWLTRLIDIFHAF